MDKLKEFELEKVKINDVIIDVKKLRYRFDNREWKAYLLFDYANDEFNFRKELEIIEPKIPDGEVIIKLPGDGNNSRIKIGKGIAENNIVRALKLFVNGEYSNDQYQLFRLLNEQELKKTDRIDFKYKSDNIRNYANSIFKIYYDHLKYYFNNFSDVELAKLKKGARNKAIAMASYLSLRDYINNRYSDYCVVSEPNVFIKNVFIEYDFLILKKGVNINQGYYEQSDVYAVVEIKTSGYFPSNSKNITRDFEELIINETANIDVPLLYIALHEGSSCGRKGNKAHYFYEQCLKVLETNKNKVDGLFVAIKVGNSQFVVPYNYDFDNIIEEIIKK